MATALLDQQLWFLGLDIRHDDGNQLLQYGFERLPSPDGRGMTCYQFADGRDPALGGCTLAAWGFGIRCTAADGSAVVVRRFGFTPRRQACTAGVLPAWSPADLGALLAPVGRAQLEQSWQALAGACAAFARYETWALARFGMPHRHWCLAGRPKTVRRRMIAPHAVPDRWCEVSTWCLAAAAGTSA